MRLTSNLTPNIDFIITKRQPIRQPQKEESHQTPQNRRFFEEDVVPAGIEPASKV